MDNQLQRQIQEEMDRELLKNTLNRFLKKHGQFKLVDKKRK